MKNNISNVSKAKDEKINKDFLDFKTNYKIEIVHLLEKNKYLKKYYIKNYFEIGENKYLSNLFEKQFKELIKDKVIQKGKEDKYKLSVDNYFIGKIFFNSIGNGFVSDKNEDYFINKKDILNALHEDIVLVIKTKHSTNTKRAEGKVISVLERNITKLVGTFIQYEKGAFVLPDNDKINRDIYIPDRFKNNAKSYDKVEVKIVKYPTYKTNDNNTLTVFNPEGEIVEILGVSGEKGVDSLSIIKENNIRDGFPSEVNRESERISSKILNEEKEKRLDLTNEIIYTIDGIDAKDLDDAISVKKIGDNFELGVHIADVTHYVKENGAIDHEALLRGTSVYLVDQVIPMLPKILCNNVCSLNPNEEKLTLSCIMKINELGQVINSKVVESIIKSKARLVYEDVSKYLEDNNIEFEKKYPEVSTSLKIGQELSEILFKKRLKRGSIEFDTPEPQFILDDDGKVIEIKPYERGIANNLIEEFMLIANETIAEKFNKLKIPFVYRVHENPRQEKLELFDKIAENYGIKTCFSENENINSKELQEFLEENQKNDNIESFKILLLQSMQQARYSNKCLHHFGLGSDYYCHFTSPIRRYPDLQIHRIIKDSLHGNINKITKEKYEKKTEEVAEYCSKAERKADQAERDLDKAKMYEYICNHKNEEFIGKVKSFNKTGFFICLDNTAEGYVKPLNFEFDKDSYTGFLNEQEIRLGQKLKVKLKNSNNNNSKEILFDIIEIIKKE